MTELSRGKSLVVLAIVIGCFAILWPKIFYPMFQGSVAPTTTTTTTTTPPPAHPPFRDQKPGTLCCGLVFENDVTSAAFLAELCSAVLKNQASDQQQVTTAPPPPPPPQLLAIHLTDPVFNECRRDLLAKCGIDLDDIVKSDVDGAVADRRLANKFHGKVRAKNLTTCLLANYDIDENLVRSKKSYHRPQDVLYPRHMRPERPPHLHPDGVHPALREKGRVIPPTRTIEKQAKPGPMPGMRPPMGAGGHIVSPPSGTGSMGILMPIYTIGIVVFFCYTLMKIFFKNKQQPESTEPRIKDFHMDPEHRKYLFAEDYCTVSGPDGRPTDIHVKEYALLQEQQRLLVLEQQLRRSRSRTPPESVVSKNEERVEDLQTIPEHVCTHREELAVYSKTVETAPTNLTEAEDLAVVEEPTVPAEVQPVEAQSGEQEEADKEEGHYAGDKDTKKATIPDGDLSDADERLLRLAYAALKAQKDEEVDQLRRRLEETEKAMERICRQMGNVTDKLLPTAVAELFTSQLQEAEKQDEQVSVVEESLPASEISEDIGTVEEVKSEEHANNEEPQLDSVSTKLEESSGDVEQAQVDEPQVDVEAKEPEQVAEEQVFEEEVKPTSFAEMVAKTQEEEPVVEETPILSTFAELESEPIASEQVLYVAQEDTQPEPVVEESPVQPETKQGVDQVEEPEQVTDEQAIAECLMADHVKPTSFADMIAKVHEEEPVVEEEVQSSVAQFESSQPEPTDVEQVFEAAEAPVVEEVSIESEIVEEIESPQEPEQAIDETHAEEPVIIVQTLDTQFEASQTEQATSVTEIEQTQPEPVPCEEISSEVIEVVPSEPLLLEETEQTQSEPVTTEEISSEVTEVAPPEYVLCEEEEIQLGLTQPEPTCADEEVERVDQSVAEESTIQEAVIESAEAVQPQPNEELVTSEDSSPVVEKESAIEQVSTGPVTEAQVVEVQSENDEESQLESMLQAEALKVIESIEECIIPKLDEVISTEQTSDSEVVQEAMEKESAAQVEVSQPEKHEENVFESIEEPSQLNMVPEKEALKVIESIEESIIPATEVNVPAEQESEVFEEQVVLESAQDVPERLEEVVSDATQETSQLNLVQEEEALKFIEESIISTTEESAPTEQEHETVEEKFEIESAQEVQAFQPEKLEEIVSDATEETSSQLNLVQEEEALKVIEESIISTAEESAPAEQKNEAVEEMFETESTQELLASQPENFEEVVSEAVEEPSQSNLVQEEEALKVIESVEQCIIPDAEVIVSAEQQVDVEAESVEEAQPESAVEVAVQVDSDSQSLEKEPENIVPDEDVTGDSTEYYIQTVEEDSVEKVEETMPEVPVHPEVAQCALFGQERIGSEDVEQPQSSIPDEKDTSDFTVDSQTTVEDTVEKVEEPMPEAPVHPEIARCALFDQQRLGSEERKFMVSGIELTAEMEDHGKMPAELLPRVTPDRHHPKAEAEPQKAESVPSVLLETTIPPESHLVVSEAECSAEVVPPEQLDLDETEYESSPVVLSGKMTLSVIGMELTAEAPDVHPETYIVDEPEGHRSVRFPAQPTDKVYLIPSEPEEETSEAAEDVPRIVEEDDEKLDEPLDNVIYRPPTPPLHHLDDEEQTTEDVEFLTYEQLEEAGEIEIEETEAVQEEIQEQYEAVTSFTSSAQPFYVDSGLEPVEEEPEMVEDEKPEVEEQTQEHESIVQMAQQIREVELTNQLPAPEAIEESPVQESAVENSSQFSENIQESLELIENTVNSADEIVSATAESLAVECDTETVTAEPPVATLSQAVENADIVSQSLADRILMDVEYQVLPTSESSSSVGTIQESSEPAQEIPNVDEEDYERNRDLSEIEHSLEQIEVRTGEAEPSISNFIIREDYPVDETTQAMTEEEILQARKEIEAIKKLLADVTSNVTESDESATAAATSGDQSSVANELAHAMAEDGALLATSKGSSPDMDEFEVIRPSESAAIESLGSKLSSSSES